MKILLMILLSSASLYACKKADVETIEIKITNNGDVYTEKRTKIAKPGYHHEEVTIRYKRSPLQKV